MLYNRFYADIFTGKECCNLRQNPGFVINGKTTITTGLNIAGGNEVRLGYRSKRCSRRTKISFAPLGDGDQIGDHRAGRGQFTGAFTVKNLGVNRTTDNFHSVKLIANIRQECIVRHKCGMHAHLNATAHHAGYAEQFDSITEFAGKIDIQCGDVRDTLFENIAGRDALAKRETTEKRELLSRIRAIDIHGGIGFGKPFVLCFFEHGTKVLSGFCHSGEDVVRRAVEDAVNRLNIVGDQTLAERLDNGNATTHTGFKAESNIIFNRCLKKAIAAFGKKSFVRRNHIFAILKCREDEIISRINTAHHFDHNLNCRIRDHIHGIGRKTVRRQINCARFGQIAHSDFANIEVETPNVFKFILAIPKDACHTPAHNTHANHANTNRHFYLIRLEMKIVAFFFIL